MKNTVSVALCTYNGEKYLERQVDSYLQQTILPNEIVICDDRSTDQTVKILQNYIDNNTSILWRLVQNEQRLGASRNFEKAIGLCNGDLVFLSDQDDIWKRTKVEQTISYFNDNPGFDACFSNAELIGDDDHELESTLLDNTFFKPAVRKNFISGDLLYWNILLGNMITGATMAIRRSAFPDILPFYLDIGRRLWHDGWIGLMLLAKNRIGYLDQLLIQYRIHDGQQIGIVVRNDPFEKLIMLKEYKEEHSKEYFQKYLSGYRVINKLKKIYQIDPLVETRITKEYLDQRKKYFDSQSFVEKKFRLLKWYLQGRNYITIKDLMTL